MGTNNFRSNTEIAFGQKIRPIHVLQLIDALNGALVSRKNNTVEAGSDIGTLNIPWGTIFADSLVLNGKTLDSSFLDANPNSIISGLSTEHTASIHSPSSSSPRFIELANTTDNPNRIKVRGATVPLVCQINGVRTTLNEDVELDLVTPSWIDSSYDTTKSINVSDATVNIRDRKRYGEEDFIAGDTPAAGRVKYTRGGADNQIFKSTAYKHGTGSNLEIFRVEKVIDDYLLNLQRGIALNKTGNIEPQDIVNNTKLTALATATILLDQLNPQIPVVTYEKIDYSTDTPLLPVANQYWFDMNINRFKRYTGTQWVEVNRIPIGEVYMDNTGVIGVRCFDFNRGVHNLNTCVIDVQRFGSTSKVYSKAPFSIAVHGQIIDFKNIIEWDISETTSFSGYRYLYITEKGEPVKDTNDIAPIYRPDLRGYYHRYETWRCVAKIYVTANQAQSTRNYFPHQKYHSNATIPTSFNLELDSDSTLEEVDDIVSPYGSRNSGHATGRIRFNLKTDFFGSDPPFVQATPHASNVFITAATTALLVSIQTTNSSGTYTSSDVFATISFSGKTAMQVKLDNSLKG